MKLPTEDIDVKTPEGMRKTKQLIADLTASDRKNARAVRDAKLFNKRQQSIYNKSQPKNKALLTKAKGV